MLGKLADGVLRDADIKNGFKIKEKGVFSLFRPMTSLQNADNVLIFKEVIK